VELDPVHAGAQHVLGRDQMAIDDGLHVGACHLARRVCGHRPTNRRGSIGAGSLEFALDLATQVADLRKEERSLLVHSVAHAAIERHALRGIARDALGPPERVFHDADRFEDDECGPTTRPGAVIFHVAIGRHVRRAEIRRVRGHEHAIAGAQAIQNERTKHVLQSGGRHGWPRHVPEWVGRIGRRVFTKTCAMAFGIL
jgi:hypothetical protein